MQAFRERAVQHAMLLRRCGTASNPRHAAHRLSAMPTSFSSRFREWVRLCKLVFAAQVRCATPGIAGVLACASSHPLFTPHAPSLPSSTTPFAPPPPVGFDWPKSELASFRQNRNWLCFAKPPLPSRNTPARDPTCHRSSFRQRLGAQASSPATLPTGCSRSQARSLLSRIEPPSSFRQNSLKFVPPTEVRSAKNAFRTAANTRAGMQAQRGHSTSAIT